MSESAFVLPSVPTEVSADELATRLAGKLCHDFISPASAIVSGLDLLDDPTAKDMREEAMGLIAASARKLVDLLAFARVAFGSAAGAEAFDSSELEKLARGVFAHMRADLDWKIPSQPLAKPAARALLSLVQLGGGALPMGGVAAARVERAPSALALIVEAKGQRARLHEEVRAGLAGEPLGEGLADRWTPAYFLHTLVRGAGGYVSAEAREERVTLSAMLPG